MRRRPPASLARPAALAYNTHVQSVAGSPMTLRRLVLLACVGALLAACGTRGDPERPPGAVEPDPEQPVLLDPLVKP